MSGMVPQHQLQHHIMTAEDLALEKEKLRLETELQKVSDRSTRFISFGMSPTHLMVSNKAPKNAPCCRKIIFSLDFMTIIDSRQHAALLSLAVNFPLITHFHQPNRHLHFINLLITNGFKKYVLAVSTVLRVTGDPGCCCSHLLL